MIILIPLVNYFNPAFYNSTRVFTKKLLDTIQQYIKIKFRLTHFLCFDNINNVTKTAADKPQILQFS